MKVTQKVIKDYNAIDVTRDDAPLKGIKTIRGICFSVGMYGVNGLLMEDYTTGIFYKITARSTNLFKYL